MYAVSYTHVHMYIRMYMYMYRFIHNEKYTYITSAYVLCVRTPPTVESVFRYDQKNLSLPIGHDYK